MPTLTPDGLRIVGDVAQRQGFSLDAALALLDSLSHGGGFQAQFNHPELGGMGQWSRGGMIMIGDMFNTNLKYRVDGLCNELAGLLNNQPSIVAPAGPPPPYQGQGNGGNLFVQGSGAWWPPELGQPSSSGSQNDMRYAYFPGARRVAIQQGGRVSVYDSGDHQLYGVSQQQSGGQSLTFDSQYGIVRVADLPLVSGEAGPAPATPIHYEAPPPPAPAPPPQTSDIFALIEGLAALRAKNILTDEEFAAKKAELLSRL
jgi:hypothetical protein